MFAAVGKVCLSFDVSQRQHVIKDTSNLSYDLNVLSNVNRNRCFDLHLIYRVHPLKLQWREHIYMLYHG